MSNTVYHIALVREVQQKINYTIEIKTHLKLTEVVLIVSVPQNIDIKTALNFSMALSIKKLSYTVTNSIVLFADSVRSVWFITSTRGNTISL